MTVSIAEIAAKLKSGVESQNALIKTSIESRFEASSAKLKADIDNPPPKKTVAPVKPVSSGIWFLARKPWSWKYRD